jgi:MaoC like domain
MLEQVQAPDPVSIEFNGMPGRVGSYVRTMLSRKPSLAPAEAPLTRIDVTGRGLRIPARAVRNYLAVCGTTGTHDAVPPLYPQVFALPLHLKILTSPVFPVRPLGVVHLRNVVRQSASVPMDTDLDMHTALVAKREVDAGQEYDIATRCSVDGAVPWEAMTTFLVRRPASEVRGRPPRPPSLRGATSTDFVAVAVPAPEDIGRRYAGCSGDYNPIHWNDRTAGWFGFRKAIAHGMWSLAASLVAAKRDVYVRPFEIEARFSAPIYLPADLMVVQLDAGSNAAPERYVLRDAHKPRVHLEIDVLWR